MKTATTRNLSCIAAKIMLGLVLALMVGSMNVVSAGADDDRGRKEGQDKGRYEKRGRGHERERYEPRRRVYRSYGYTERVYLPPPVIFVPPPPPGIDIFFPSIHIGR